MKNIVKIILLIVAVVASVAAIYYYSSKPLAVETVTAEKSEAEMYFIEKGEAVSSDEVDIYTMMTGKIQELYVKENDYVEEGGVICVLDTSELSFKIDELDATIKSYEAQISNLSLQETKEKDSLKTSKSDLQAQLKGIDARKSSTDSTKTDQAGLQRVINSQYSENLSYAQEKLTNSYDNIKYAEENLTFAKNNVEYAEKDLVNAEEDFEKSKVLFENGVISQFEYDNAERTIDNYRKALDAAKKSVEDAEKALSDSQKAITDFEKQVEDSKYMIEQGNKQLSVIETSDPTSSEDYYASLKEQLQVQISGIDSQISKTYNASMTDYYSALIGSCQVNIDSLKDKIEDYTITSPSSGVIDKLFIENWNFVSPQAPLAKVLETRKDEIEVYITTNNIDEIKIGQEVELILKRRDEDKYYKGKVTKIDDKATTKISSLGIEEKRVKITVKPDNPEIFKGGYDVDVKFVYYKAPDAITVPKTALFKVDDKDMVWVIKDDKLKLTPVEKGRELRTDFVIDTGLSENDIVVKDANEKDLDEGKKAKGAE